MKIIVLHGDNIAKSYERLVKFIDTAKSRSWEVSYVGESTESIEETLSKSSLFGAERFFILKDIKKIGKKEMSWLKKKIDTLEGNLIIYSDTIINKTFLNSLPGEIKIEEFSLPKIIWAFLEHIYPGNSRIVLKEFYEITKKDAPELVFSLLAKQFRDLYWVKTDPISTGFPSWKIGKLKSQASKFSDEQLVKSISVLSNIDFEAKTGGNLTDLLEMFFIKL